MSIAYVVETSGLTKRFGERVAVDNVDLRVPSGSAFGYLGPNGAGKTTLIRMLLGLTGATAGTMRLLGRPVPAQRAAALARVGAIVEEPRFHRYLSGRENLAVIAAAREHGAHRRTEGRSSASGSPSGRTSASPPTRSGCASASGSRAPSWPTRSSSFWTSRRTASTRPASTSSGA
jgi:ABC-type sugar transport system ATPase subunit